MRYTQEEYKKALEVLQGMLPYNLQKKDPVSGVWRNVGRSVRGRDAAYAMLERAKDSTRDTGAEFRVLPKNEADKYAEGFAAGRGDKGEKKEHGWGPLMALPEHL